MSEHRQGDSAPSDAATADRNTESFSVAEPNAKTTVGWREWVALPELGLTAIKAKIDTGARTSALHAIDIVEETADDGKVFVNFTTQPVQNNDAIQLRCRAPLVDKRKVTDSGGHASERLIVSTSLAIGGRVMDVEVSLTDRTGLLLRMLVGRTSLVPNFKVDPSQSYVFGKQNVRDHYMAHLPNGDQPE